MIRRYNNPLSSGDLAASMAGCRKSRSAGRQDVGLEGLSQKPRKQIEEAFGWAKTVGGMTQTVYRGVERVRFRFILTMAANNLARLPRLLAA